MISYSGRVKSRDTVRGGLGRPRHPCLYGEESKMALIKRVNN